MKLLQNSVQRQAEHRPEAVAIVFGQQSISYGELDEASTRLGRLLRSACNCQRGDRVALLLEKSIPAIVAMLGALKADCIYVPLDTSNPHQRLRNMLDICEPKAILADSANKTKVETICEGSSKPVRVGWLTPNEVTDANCDAAFCWDDLSSVPILPLDSANHPDDPAHILFTSGSTGFPKGVVITHGNVLQFLEWATTYFRTAPEDRISCHPPLHFDLSTFDIYGTFKAGAQLYLVPQELSLLPHKAADFIRQSELTQWFSAPSALKYMAQFDVIGYRDFPSLKRLMWCGEAMPIQTLCYLMDRLPGVQFTNLYGPTEATIASTYYTVPRRPKDLSAQIPIGAACDGETVLVLDDEMNQVRDGEIGQVYIGGAGLSPGYWRDPAKTQPAFLNHPQYGRVYKTGDLGRMGGDGLIYLLGRRDSQIKSRGHRIELGEIEAALNAVSFLRDSAVVAIQSSGFEGSEICCGYVPAPGAEVSPSRLRKQLREMLPPYMIPSRWLAFSALPLNGNGKCDRARLQEHFFQGNGC